MVKGQKRPRRLAILLLALMLVVGACSSTDLSFDAQFVDATIDNDFSTGGDDASGTTDADDTSVVAEVADTVGADVSLTCKLLFPTKPKMELVISEVVPGPSGFIELHNPTNTDFSVNSLGGSGYQLCEPSVCKKLSEIDSSMQIAAGGYARFAIPSAFTKASDSFGELVLYNGEVKPENVIDYICWGTGAFVSKGDGGKWAGDCVTTIPTGKALKRVSDSDGLTASSYSVAGDPSGPACQ